MKKITLLTFLTMFCVSLNAQQFSENEFKDYTNPDELVTLADYLSFNDAIEVLSKISENTTGKKIVSTADIAAPIGIDIEKMHYKKALLIIVQYNNLTYEEKESVIIVSRKEDTSKKLDGTVYASVDSREVKISALLFEASVADMRERGINWEAILSKSGLSIGTNVLTFSEENEQDSNSGQIQRSPEFKLGTEADFEMGDFKGSATTMFKFFESENLGEIIAMPSITVRDKTQGRIQIGSDISIKQRDFAGNVIDQFYATGTIVQVTPYLYNEDGVDYILMKLNVERSSAEPDVVSTEIRKTTAQTEILMLHNEEAVIGGLFVNEETKCQKRDSVFKGPAMVGFRNTVFNRF